MNACSEVDPSSPVTPFDRKAALGDALRCRILNMELAPDSALDEVLLANEFGLSRPPVRELLRQIAAEGYIELAANRAPRVASMSHESLRSFFLAAPLIYSATTQLAALHATAAEVEALKAIQQQFRRAIAANDVDARVIHNDAFHLEIGRMAHNDYLMPSLRRLLIDHARLGRMFYRHPSTDDMQRDLQLACEQHDQMIEAIQQGDAERAAGVVGEHFELSRKRMAEYATPVGMDMPMNG